MIIVYIIRNMYSKDHLYLTDRDAGDFPGGFHQRMIYKFLIGTNFNGLVGRFGVRMSVSSAEQGLTSNYSLST